MKKIAVLFGGCSSEYEVSLQSAYAVIKNIDPARFTVFPVGISREGSWYLYQGELEKIPSDAWEGEDCCAVTLALDRKVHGLLCMPEGKMDYSADKVLYLDAVLPILHGKNGEDGTVQGAFELAGIPVIGCGVLSSALCMDKERAHRIAAAAGVKVPESRVLTEAEWKTRMKPDLVTEQLRYPLFVKPLRAGSSFGITKVAEEKELPDAIARAFAYDTTVIMEEMIPGFEVGCAVLEDGKTGELLVGEVDEIELSEGFFDYEEKYHLKTSKIHVPARIEKRKADEIKEVAKTIYRSLDCRDFARVDMFLTPEGEIYFNEVNTIPGFTEHSRFPGMMRAAGISFREIIDRLLAGVEANGR